MKICSFLWVYYGYPTSTYEGVNVEVMRNECGKLLSQRDKDNNIEVDCVAGVPDSGTAHAVGYSNESKIPFSRPFIKYTPTWPRSFMPTSQKQRNMIAKMKLIPVKELIKDKKLLLIDDSIVRGTQLGETTQFLYDSGAKEVHVRPACPPIMFGCKFLNFSRSSSEMELITRRVIYQLEDGNVTEIHCTYDPETKSGSGFTGRKVKGTIHWVAAKTAKTVEVRLYENIVDEEKGVYNEDGSVNVNPNSLTVLDTCYVEPALADAKPGDKFQFMRTGFFCVDTKDTTEDHQVFNRIVSLKSSYRPK